VEFLCSVFSGAALHMIDPLVRMHKIPSGRIADLELLRRVAATGKPTLVSTGMATESEIRLATGILRQADCPPGVMQCTTMYPTPAPLVGLDKIPAWGLSDHSGTIYPGIAAATLGCSVLEVHVCFTRAYGLDAAASLTIVDLGQLVNGVRFVEAARKGPATDEVAASLGQVRQVFMGV
jgi:N,N'-diacetyllegionaminate synthase